MEAAILGFVAFVAVIGLGWAAKKLRMESLRDVVWLAFAKVERAIPDDTPNKALAKTDAALRYFNAEFQKRFGYQPSDGIQDLAKKLWAEFAARQKEGRE